MNHADSLHVCSLPELFLHLPLKASLVLHLPAGSDPISCQIHRTFCQFVSEEDETRAWVVLVWVTHPGKRNSLLRSKYPLPTSLPVSPLLGRAKDTPFPIGRPSLFKLPLNLGITHYRRRSIFDMWYGCAVSRQEAVSLSELGASTTPMRSIFQDGLPISVVPAERRKQTVPHNGKCISFGVRQTRIWIPQVLLTL